MVSSISHDYLDDEFEGVEGRECNRTHEAGAQQGGVEKKCQKMGAPTATSAKGLMMTHYVMTKLSYRNTNDYYYFHHDNHCTYGRNLPKPNDDLRMSVCLFSGGRQSEFAAKG